MYLSHYIKNKQSNKTKQNLKSLNVNKIKLFMLKIILLKASYLRDASLNAIAQKAHGNDCCRGAQNLDDEIMAARNHVSFSLFKINQSN